MRQVLDVLMSSIFKVGQMEGENRGNQPLLRPLEKVWPSCYELRDEMDLPSRQSRM